MNKLKFIYDLSIKNKIIVIVLFITFLTHSLGFTFITIWDVDRIQSEIETGLAMNAKLVANNCVAPLAFGDNKQATEALAHLKNIEFIETCHLFDVDGKLFASYPDTLNRNSILAFEEQQDNIFKDDYFYVKEQVFYQNEKYGTLFIKANSEPLKSAKQNIIITLVLLSIVLDILSILLAIKLQKYISLPIVKLKNHFDDIAENEDYSVSLIKQNNDEIGSLYDGFNNMLSQINFREKESSISREELNKSEKRYKKLFQDSPIPLWDEDFSEVKKHIDELKKTGIKNFKEYFENNLELVSELAKKVKIVEFNKMVKELHEASSDRELINGLPSIFTESSLNGFIEELVAIAENKSSCEFETEIKSIHGEVKYIHLKWMVVSGFGETLKKVIISTVDITKRKKNEIELIDYKKNLEKMVEQRTKELEVMNLDITNKNNELKEYNNLFLGRELRIKELKDKIKELEKPEFKTD